MQFLLIEPVHVEWPVDGSRRTEITSCGRALDAWLDAHGEAGQPRPVRCRVTGREDREDEGSFYVHQVILHFWKQSVRRPGIIHRWEVQGLPALPTSGPGSGFWFLGPSVCSMSGLCGGLSQWDCRPTPPRRSFVHSVCPLSNHACHLGDTQGTVWWQGVGPS